MNPHFDFSLIDEVFAEFHVVSPQPGLAYGVVAEGKLVHAGGCGELSLDGSTPDADSVFRIASMTKSFTATALLLLRDEGKLSLDDPVSIFVPELAELRGPTRDSPPVTLRALLTMSAGFPTDDPWADRQLPVTADEFDALLDAGFSLAWVPGTSFEYSNLGWALLGRVIAAIEGEDYRQVLVSRVLRPLGMCATVFEAEEVPAAQLARGHRQVDGEWAELPFAGHGEFAPMGGLFSSLRDLAVWVGEFTDAFPPRDSAQGKHVLSRSTRREMQQVHRAITPCISFWAGDGPLSLLAGGYGMGLIVEQHPQAGDVVWHLGGLPGFGSAMRWHPASGLGVVALANATYSPCFQAVTTALDILLRSPARVPARVQPWPSTEAAKADVTRLLSAWDPDLASRVFAINVEMDEPLHNRQAEVERIVKQVGELTADPSSRAEVISPAAIRWCMRGDRGRVRVEIRMSPERRPTVQTLELTVVPHPTEALWLAAEALIEATTREFPEWPTGLALGRDRDPAVLGRALRMTLAFTGKCRLGEQTAGVAGTSATFRVSGEYADADLSIAIDPVSAAVTDFSLVPSAIGEKWF